MMDEGGQRGLVNIDQNMMSKMENQTGKSNPAERHPPVSIAEKDILCDKIGTRKLKITWKGKSFKPLILRITR
jgi:hypothetical protein